MYELNETLLSLIDEYGLKAVLEGLSVTCSRKEEFAADGEDDGKPEDWVTDRETIDEILPKIINE